MNFMLFMSFAHKFTLRARIMEVKQDMYPSCTQLYHLTFCSSFTKKKLKLCLIPE